MTAKIYIATKSNTTRYTYWVYDPDGDPSSGDERVIRGGIPHLGSDDYIIEADRSINESRSRDALNGDDPYQDRYYTTVVEGSATDVQNIWNNMVDDPVAHLEIRSLDPDRAALPITETGYRSHFVPALEVTDLGGPVGYVRMWPDEAAQSAKWKMHQEKTRQLSFF